AADEKRHDHVRENHDIAQRQDRIVFYRAGACRLARLGHFSILFEQFMPERWRRRGAVSRRPRPGRRRTRCLEADANSSAHAAFFIAFGINIQGTRLSLDDIGANDDLFDALKARKLKHRIEQDAFHDRAQTTRAGAPVDGFFGDDVQGLVLEREFRVFHFEEALILLDERILRLGQDFLQGVFVEIVERRDYRQSADEFRDQSKLQQILRFDSSEKFTGPAVVWRLDSRAKSDRRTLAACRDNFFEAGEGAAANEQNIGRIDLQKFLLRVLASALRRHRRDSAFHDFQECLLDALARHIAGDRWIVGFARDLVDLVDVDDPALRPLDIIIGGLKKLQNDIFDILADITCLGQRRGVGHREGHVENSRQGLREQGLARTGGPDQQNIRFGKLDIIVLGGMIEALVMIVDGDRQYPLGLRLPDDVIVQNLADFLGGRNAVAAFDQRGLVLLADDIHAQFDAFIADENRRTRDELAHL